MPLDGDDGGEPEDTDEPGVEDGVADNSDWNHVWTDELLLLLLLLEAGEASGASESEEAEGDSEGGW